MIGGVPKSTGRISDKKFGGVVRVHRQIYHPAAHHGRSHAAQIETGGPGRILEEGVHFPHRKALRTGRGQEGFSAPTALALRSGEQQKGSQQKGKTEVHCSLGLLR